ncbi:hypothetical protein NGM10_15735 (plasmid) [Halorussus salilacus]|uniref:hypothetical protein n=1 Tax=Halorussus salilacus TaxID=2953750 RepID=UPI00209D9F88|nr:hypothetical protein [Halorussus salilacus]USZ69854.1 hypothetical protein NGM10_15735 [Halorussus salilacus]
MRRSALHAVALALLVATAGCSGFAPQSGDDATTTETTATEEQTTAEESTEAEETTAEGTTAEETTDEDGDATALAPGLSEDGVEEPLALSNAHQERLGDESLTISNHRVERYANGTVRNESTRTTRTAANRTRYRLIENTTLPNWVTGANNEGELWANGTHVFSARERNGTMTYIRQLGPDSEPTEPRELLVGDLTADDDLLTVFSAFENERVEELDEENATAPERYRVTASDLAHADFLADGTEVRNATLDAVVETDGPESAFVREYTLRYETEIDGETVRVTERIRFSDVGETTVERPEWYDGAANETE